MLKTHQLLIGLLTSCGLMLGGLRNCLRSSLNFDILLQKGNYDD